MTGPGVVATAVPPENPGASRGVVVGWRSGLESPAVPPKKNPGRVSEAGGVVVAVSVQERVIPTLLVPSRRVGLRARCSRQFLVSRLDESQGVRRTM